MNCQEVSELVQRELDRDLSKSEQRQLYEHLERCPSCMEVFQRLKRISEALEELPRVTPPFSIVDTILPKLRELGYPHPERPKHEQGETESSSVPGSPFHVRWWKKFPVKAAGGVIAAGLILGLWMAYHEPSPLEQASSRGEENALMFQGNMESKGDAESGMKDQGVSATTFRGKAKDSAQAGASGNSTREEEISTLDEEAEKQAFRGQDQEVALIETQPISIEQAALPGESDPRKAVPREAEDGKSVSGESVTPFGVTSVREADKGEQVESRGDGGEKRGAAESKETETAAVKELATKDGTLVAYVKDRRIYIRNKYHESVFASPHRWNEGDEIILESWSGDNRYFTYAVVSGKKTMRFTVDVEKKVEKEK